MYMDEDEHRRSPGKFCSSYLSLPVLGQKSSVTSANTDATQIPTSIFPSTCKHTRSSAEPEALGDASSRLRNMCQNSLKNTHRGTSPCCNINISPTGWNSGTGPDLLCPTCFSAHHVGKQWLFESLWPSCHLSQPNRCFFLCR